VENSETGFPKTKKDMLKHWLLNLAVRHPIWLGLLFPSVEGEALNVKPVPGCGPEDYARGLVELIESGMVRLSSQVPGDEVESLVGVSQILDRFLKLAKDDSILRRDDRLLKPYQRNRLPGMKVSFRLTALGGETWSEVAEPDWMHIVTESGDAASGDIISPDRDRLMATIAWYPELNQEQVQLETIKWQTHSDFEVLYWKRLPFVYHVSFARQVAQVRWANAETEWFRDWRFSLSSWYKEPWELPDWPSD